jgi:hypothetical protein
MNLDMDELPRLASVDPLDSDAAPEKRMPAIMDNSKLPDMGRMTG